MKYLVKKSVLLLLVVLAFCACDNSNDNGEGIQPNPQPSKSVVNYTGEVEFVVDAPQIREDIEQDLKANPPFGGSRKYQFITKKYSTLPAVYIYSACVCATEAKMPFPVIYLPNCMAPGNSGAASQRLIQPHFSTIGIYSFGSGSFMFSGI